MLKYREEKINFNYFDSSSSFYFSFKVSSSVNLKLRSKRIDDPKKTFQTTESLISFLVCPPPPKSL